jgi:hypothetical protein
VVLAVLAAFGLDDLQRAALVIPLALEDPGELT